LRGSVSYPQGSIDYADSVPREVCKINYSKFVAIHQLRVAVIQQILAIVDWVNPPDGLFQNLYSPVKLFKVPVKFLRLCTPDKVVPRANRLNVDSGEEYSKELLGNVGKIGVDLLLLPPPQNT